MPYTRENAEAKAATAIKNDWIQTERHARPARPRHPSPPDVEPGLTAGFLICQNGYTLEDIPRILTDRKEAAWDNGGSVNGSREEQI
ncbi:hypothetical protein CONLIGDRAFT_684979 [Coniochaeta ligniaria NRRL 30616]|uniref:Uncharacterized protein n=1 Tax=Coniochaeta ligniaria NRRL 30616 TaxID=1408157 RepID=A0A1J7J7G5_9PEZI|nr:hypothetical protein CONLIGDRAFT_684979 [Coniochaeta ligniaria NRRL 30616]